MDKIGFLQEKPNQNSITRLMFALIVSAAVFIALHQELTKGVVDWAGFISMTGVAATLKLVQKGQEKEAEA